MGIKKYWAPLKAKFTVSSSIHLKINKHMKKQKTIAQNEEKNQLMKQRNGTGNRISRQAHKKFMED